MEMDKQEDLWIRMIQMNMFIDSIEDLDIQGTFNFLIEVHILVNYNKVSKVHNYYVEIIIAV